MSSHYCHRLGMKNKVHRMRLAALFDRQYSRWSLHFVPGWSPLECETGNCNYTKDIKRASEIKIRKEYNIAIHLWLIINYNTYLSLLSELSVKVCHEITYAGSDSLGTCCITLVSLFITWEYPGLTLNEVKFNF